MIAPGRGIAATVTRGAVRCSAWLGVIGWSREVLQSVFGEVATSDAPHWLFRFWRQVFDALGKARFRCLMLRDELSYLCRVAVTQCSYRCRVGFIECRYRLRLAVLKCRNLSRKLEVLRGGFERLVLGCKVARLNRLEKRLKLSNERCRLAILDAINKLDEKAVDKRDGFDGGHIVGSVIGGRAK